MVDASRGGRTNTRQRDDEPPGEHRDRDDGKSDARDRLRSGVLSRSATCTLEPRPLLRAASAAPLQPERGCGAGSPDYPSLDETTRVKMLHRVPNHYGVAKSAHLLNGSRSGVRRETAGKGHGYNAVREPSVNTGVNTTGTNRYQMSSQAGHALSSTDRLTFVTVRSLQCSAGYKGDLECWNMRWTDSDGPFSDKFHTQRSWVTQSWFCGCATLALSQRSEALTMGDEEPSRIDGSALRQLEVTSDVTFQRVPEESAPRETWWVGHASSIERRNRISLGVPSVWLQVTRMSRQ